MAKRPQVALHFDTNGADDIVILAGTASRVDGVPPPDVNPDYVAKYADGMVKVSGNAAQYAAEYSVPLRVEILRVRGW